MNTIKQPLKRDNACQKPLGITQFFKNGNLRNDIKNVFGINLHHSPIKV
jgi:hypothetical protein